MTDHLARLTAKAQAPARCVCGNQPKVEAFRDEWNHADGFKDHVLVVRSRVVGRLGPWRQGKG